MIARPVRAYPASSPSTWHTHQDLIRAACVFLCLFAVYLLTYRGGFHSIDEVSMFAVTENLVKFGQVNTDQIAWTQWTTSQREAQGFFGPDGHVYSKKGLVLSLAMAPLYWVGWVVPGLGMLQTASLINCMVTAVTGGLLFLTVLRLGYEPRVALVTALIGGLATISWVYSKYLFSEPLAGLFLLAAMYAAVAYRHGGRGLWACLAGLVLGLAVATRANNLFVVPWFAFYLVAAAWWCAGQTKTSPAWRPVIVGRVLLWFVVGLLPPTVLMLGYNWLRSGNPLQTGYDLTIFSPDILSGLYKLLFSPLRGLFVYSPVLLLCIPGIMGWLRARRAETLLLCSVVGVTLLLFAAWTSGEGLSWGSRFLVPVVPLLCLALAPVADRAWRGQAVVAVALILFSLASLVVQVLGVAINPWVFLGGLQAEMGGEFFLERTAALSDFRYTQILGQLHSWSLANSDVAWWQPWGLDGLALGLGVALLVLSGGTSVWVWRRVAADCDGAHGQRAALIGLAVAIGASLIVPPILLGRYYLTDRQFGPIEEPYTAALEAAVRSYPPPGAIVTVAPYHYHVAMNRFKAAVPLIGFARTAPPLPDTAPPLLDRALGGDRVALVTVGVPPAAPDNAVEELLANAAFKVSDDWHGDARRVLFVTGQPDVTAEIQLTPEGALRRLSLRPSPLARAGGRIAVEITWQPLRAPDTDLNVFLQLLDARSVPVAQLDGPPAGGYAPTSAWRVGERVADRRGLVIPTDLRGGDYRLIAGLVDPVTGRRVTAGATDFVDLGTVTVSAGGG
jgi:hypothetical protein